MCTLTRLWNSSTLPLRPTGNIELDPEAASQLLTGWSVASDPSTEKQIAMLRSQSGRVAVDGQVHEDSQSLDDAGELVLLRQVGCGRVVQPRFDLTSDWLAGWLSLDSFVNCVILDRPRRQLVRSEDSLEESLIQQRYPDFDMAVADPAMNSRLRITARDALLPLNVVLPRNEQDSEESSGQSVTRLERSSALGALSRIDPTTTIDSATGIGAWTDSSDVISLCRQILRSESGIEIPKSSLVVRALGYYLLILVPINYLVFRLLGRLEYAWLAVPLIAMGGAVWVARAARLDIGFARSQTEIALLEMQPEYPRAHLSRVVAIYNSLSSSYDVEFKTVDGAATPIWGAGGAGSQLGSAVFKTGFAEGPILSELAVGSNQVRMLHAEQLIDMGGPIVLNSNDQLMNLSSHELLDAFVVRKSADGSAQVAMVGPCAAGSNSNLRFREVTGPSITDRLPMQTRKMILRLGSPAAMTPGSTRLVARIDGSLPGMTITPSANQYTAQTIVLAHLEHAPLNTPQVDLNLIGDFRQVLSDVQPGNSGDETESIP